MAGRNVRRGNGQAALCPKHRPRNRRPRPCARRTASIWRRWSVISGSMCPARCRSSRVSQFAAGQSNPTYLIEGPDKRFVLRKKPPGTLLPSAHLVEREYRILAALAETDVPVPRVHHLCEDTAVIGTAFYVMDHVEGSVDQDPAWPAFHAGRAKFSRGAAYRSMADVLARLHRVDWRARGLADFGREGNYIARQIRRWSGPVRGLAHRRDRGDGPPAGVAPRPYPGR